MIDLETERVETGEVIEIHGAREHNLKDISVSIPRNQFVVITGVSGSGKSTVAFDILFSEGQRRFLDSMNVYARQFVEQLSRPDVDLVVGIPPTVSIEQRNTRGGGKSTVATVTEIYHFLRLLFARLGTQFCPDCHLPVEAQTRDQLGLRLEAETKRRGELRLLAPVVRNRKGFHTEVAEWAAKHGFEFVRADGKLHPTSERLRLDRFREHDVEILVGTLAPNGRRTSSRKDAARAIIDQTLELGQGVLYALGRDGKTTIHSTERSCPGCGRSFGEIDPKMLSYNSPQGWCPKCRGFGEIFYLPEVDRGARAEAIEESWFEWQEGNREICQECRGTRLNAIARSVRMRLFQAKIANIPASPTVVDFANASVDDALEHVNSWALKGREAEIARDIIPEIRERLKFLREVGLGYLQLGRGATTLSGGEGQRIRLAAQLGSNLSGVLYVLDEPTIGLHARDNERLLSALALLKSRGNSLVVVEHDEETMRRADYVIDLGPGAGTEGGTVVASGTLTEILAHGESATARCLRAAPNYPSRGSRRPVMMSARSRSRTPVLVLERAGLHNLKNLTVSIPLGRFVCVTGVSGSGKSTLVCDCLLPAIREKLKSPGGVKPQGSMITSGHELIRAVYEVDQLPIGRTPRSVPATYVGFMDEIRRLFAETPEAKMRGYSASRFSFNSAQGRCPECMGAGTIKLEMSFMPPAYVRCETCCGSRFSRETLDVQFRGRNISQVLDLTVAQALEFFAAFQRIARPLQALCDTGLGYVSLGQTSPTLSGGEAQRLKLVTHLLAGFPRAAGAELPHSKGAGSSLFILEEPTIGLHISDVRKLVDVLQRLVDAGHTVVVIEHNLDLIAEADWVIDLGPEGGEDGGCLIAQGTPEEIAKSKNSHTGDYLRKILKTNP